MRIELSGPKNRIKGFFVILLSIVILFELNVLFLGDPNLFKFSRAKSLDEEMLKGYADDIFNQCSKEDYAPTCYDEKIPKLMEANITSMEDSFRVAVMITAKDPRYIHCHTLGHALSGLETRRNPDDWKEVITRCPPSICNNGCLHGPLLVRFNREVLTDKQIEEVKGDLTYVCEPRDEWNPSNNEVSMCYHGLGHLNLYITGANVKKAVELCEYAGIKADGRNYLQTCTEGVFMQIFQQLDPEDVALVAGITPEKEDVEKFCSQFEGNSFHACRRESWPKFRMDIIDDPKSLTEFCSYSTVFLDQKRCYAAMMNMITVTFVVDQGSVDKLAEYCFGLKPNWRSDCFSNAAKRMVQIDPSAEGKSIEICNRASESGLGQECFRQITNYSVWALNSDTKQFEEYCKQLPEEWSKACLELKSEPSSQNLF